MNTIQINKLDQILSSKKTLYKYNDKLINVYRVKNDIYGNPLYHISFFNNNEENITSQYKGKLGKYYKNKGYLTVQSYNLSNTIQYLLED